MVTHEICARLFEPIDPHSPFPPKEIGLDCQVETSPTCHTFYNPKDSPFTTLFVDLDEEEGRSSKTQASILDPQGIVIRKETMVYDLRKPNMIVLSDITDRIYQLCLEADNAVVAYYRVVTIPMLQSMDPKLLKKFQRGMRTIAHANNEEKPKKPFTKPESQREGLEQLLELMSDWEDLTASFMSEQDHPEPEPENLMQWYQGFVSSFDV